MTVSIPSVTSNKYPTISLGSLPSQPYDWRLGTLSNTGMPYGLREILSTLGRNAASFAFLPADMRIFIDKECVTLEKALCEVDNIRYLVYDGWMAVSPEVGSAVSLYMSSGSDYAGLSLVEFLNNVVAGTMEKKDIP
jgi:hypothetical protein